MWEIISWTSVTSLIVVGVISLVSYLWWLSQRDYWMFRKLGISGPAPSFMFGNAIEMVKHGFFDIFTLWKEKYGNVYGISLSGQPALVVSDPDLLKEILVKKFSSFCNRVYQEFIDYKPWKDDLLRLRDDHWKHVRSILSPTFSSGKLKKMLPAINRVIQNLDEKVHDKAEKGEEVELKHLASSFTMDAIAGAAFGVHLDSLANPQDQFLQNAKELLKQRSWILPIVLTFPKLSVLLRHCGLGLFSTKATNFFLDFLHAAFKERKQDQNTKKYNDFLQLLMDAQKEAYDERSPVDAEIDFTDQLTTSKEWRNKALTDDEAAASAIIFLFAGYDTVSTVLSLTLFNLTAHPEVLKKAQKEVDTKLGKDMVTYETASQLTYLDMCMNETMRLIPPGFVADREADQDMMLGDYQVKKGFRMMIPICAIHRDPEVWPDPEKYDPERFTPEAKAARNPYSFIPFGTGPRNCIGMRLAQLEIRMVIATLLQHYTPVLCEKSVYPPVVKPLEAVLTLESELWVKFKPRT